MATPFENLVGEDSREDRVGRICDTLGYAAEGVAEASREALALNQERGFSMQEMMQISEALVKIRSNTRVIKLLFADRIQPALVEEMQKHLKEQSEGE